MTLDTTPQATGFYDQATCDLVDFAALTAQTVDLSTIPNAIAAPKNVPVYDMTALAGHLDSPQTRRVLLAEWAGILQSGAGVLVLRQACRDHGAIDAATKTYLDIIADERAAGAGAADHFAAAGSNDRIWNSLQKLAIAAPDVFTRYFANPAIDAICEAWLGPQYQMTAQINLVHPGGQAQQAHRDYHLGFQTADICATYPAHAHDLALDDAARRDRALRYVD